MGSDDKHFVIVALGDSLTVGYRFKDPYAMDPRVPYPAQLEAMLRAKLGKINRGVIIFVINKGINGDYTDGMLKRFERDVVAERPDVVVVWGGINDLGIGRKPENVFENLLRLYETTRASGAELIACTLTPTRRTSMSMRELNKLISDYCTRTGTRLADLFSQLADGDENLSAEYSDDGAHLTADGYSVVAKIVYDSIMLILGECAPDP